MLSSLFLNNNVNSTDFPVECSRLSELNDELSSILNSNNYVPKSSFLHIPSEYADTLSFFEVLRKSGMLKNYCNQNHISYEQVVSALDNSSNIEKLVDKKNDKYILDHMSSEKEYLDSILTACDPNILLDDDQRRVVLTDEDYCLVIAGAGAGKTTTVAAKVKYLVERQNVDPCKILVISYTNKAVNELKQRIIGDLHINCPIATFHSTGNAILHKQNPETLNIADPSKLYYSIQEYLKKSTLRDDSIVENLILFFATYFDAPYEGSDINAFFNNIAKSNLTTMRSELEEYERTIIDNRTKKAVTIQNELLRSIQEVEIANFLYLNNIEYEYEPAYKYNIYLSRKTYTPDFIIKQGDKISYIEHFGISEDGKNNRFSSEQLSSYKKSIADKIELHKEHNTDLMYTFSSYNDHRSLTDHLKELLELHGYSLSSRSNKEVLEKLLSSEENKYIRKLVTLIQRFIVNFKVNGYTEDDFNRMYHSTQNVRSRLFLNICNDCYLEYQKNLRESNMVDFEDMINESARVLREVKEMKQRLDFDYVIVDEYQDISRQRFDLVKALREVTDAKIIAVGDDWQSIYAFSGSDITLFTKFAEKMGYAKLLKIVRTYRNSQEVIDIAGTFIQRNPNQIQKELISPKNITDPVIIYTYDSTKKKAGGDNRSGVNYAISHAVETAIEQILLFNKDENKPDSSSILLLGRYGFDGDQLEKSGLFEYISHGSKIKSVKYPKLDITFMTAHASKGLGYDNVIVINGRNETYGFPTKIEDDPVLSFVIKSDNSIDYAEERRLFYVAMTRTKNRVFFIAPEQNPSEFLLELKHEFKNIVLNGNWNEDPTNIPSFKKPCPMCGYPMQFRYKQSAGLRLYICTNEPEICGFMTNDYRAGKLGIIKCEHCRDGYLIVKHRKNSDYFLGCTNYKSDGSGCSGYMTRAVYFEKMDIPLFIPPEEITFPPRMSPKDCCTNNNKKESSSTPLQVQADHSSDEQSDSLTIKKPDLQPILYKSIELNDVSFTILKCLSALSKTRYWGITMLVDILRGSKNQKINKYELDRIDGYNQLHNVPKDDILFIIEWLIKNNFILQTKGLYPVLHPTNKGIHYSDNINKQLLLQLAKDLKNTETNLDEEPINISSLVESKTATKEFDMSIVRVTSFLYDAKHAITPQEMITRIKALFTDANAVPKLDVHNYHSWLSSTGIVKQNPLTITDEGKLLGFVFKSDSNTDLVCCELKAQRYVITNLKSYLDYVIN